MFNKTRDVIATLLDHFPLDQQIFVVDSVMERMRVLSPFTSEILEDGGYTFVRVLGVDNVHKDFLVTTTWDYTARILAAKFVEQRGWKIKDWDTGEKFLLHVGKYKEKARELFRGELYL